MLGIAACCTGGGDHSGAVAVGVAGVAAAAADCGRAGIRVAQRGSHRVLIAFTTSAGMLRITDLGAGGWNNCRREGMGVGIAGIAAPGTDGRRSAGEIMAQSCGNVILVVFTAVADVQLFYLYYSPICKNRQGVQRKIFKKWRGSPNNDPRREGVSQDREPSPVL